MYRDLEKKSRTGDVQAIELQTRIEASPRFRRLGNKYGVEIGHAQWGPFTEQKHVESLKIMKERFDANYDHNLDGKAMKFFEEVDKAYAAQKPTPEFKEYKVEKDDTLSQIVERYYDMSGPTEIDAGYKAVARSNGITNPDKISEGQTIKLPKTLPLTAAQIATVPSAKATPEEITKMVKTVQEDLFGPEKDASGKNNPKVDGMFGPQTAKALREKHGDVNKDENFNKLSPDLQAAVQTLRENIGPGLFNQDKIIAKRDPNLSTGRQKGPTSDAFDWAAQSGSRGAYDRALADLRASREGKPFNAEAETETLNRKFAYRAGGEAPQASVTPVVTPAPEISSGTGMPLNPAKGGRWAFYP